MALSRTTDGADLKRHRSQHLSPPADLHERVASINEIDVRNDPDLALQKNCNEEQLTAVRAEYEQNKNSLEHTVFYPAARHGFLYDRNEPKDHIATRLGHSAHGV
jgi:hypothetical protein